MAQPVPADEPAGCTTTRYALNVWHLGVVHQHHRCLIRATPHPTRPHTCACGYAWPGVGAVQCSDCLAVRAIAELRKADDGKGTVVYLCLDRQACATTYAVADLATSMRTIAAHSDPEPASPARQTAAEGPRVPPPQDGATDTATAHIAGALGIVAGLLGVLEEGEPDTMPSRAMITNLLFRAMVELRRAMGDRGPVIWPNPRPHMRVPGQIRHGAVENGGRLT